MLTIRPYSIKIILKEMYTLFYSLQQRPSDVLGAHDAVVLLKLYVVELIGHPDGSSLHVSTDYMCLKYCQVVADLWQPYRVFRRSD